MNWKNLILGLALGCCINLPAQELISLDLADAVQIAKGESPTSQLADARLKNSYWRFKAFQANYKPQMFLDATLPSINRTISQIVDPETGQQNFLPISFMTNRMFLSLQQNIPLTGGQVYLSSGLQRTDNFGVLNGQAWYSTPVVIGINQPLFAFNSMKWERKVEPLRYQEAKLDNIEAREQSALEAVGSFFDVYIAQIELEAALVDKANADTLFILSKGRYEVGKIAENELLQIELSAMNADTRRAQAELNLQTSTEELRRTLNYNQKVSFKLNIPDTLPVVLIDPDKALSEAIKNRRISVEHDRRLLEAERDMMEAKVGNGISATLNGSFGLQQTAATFSGAYQNPIDQEQISLGIQIPLADWGKNRSQKEIARTNMELVQLTIKQERVAFEQGILIKVQQFDMIRRRTEIAERSFDIAQRSYDLALKRYRIGKIGITELNQALSGMQEARTVFYQALRNYWYAFYEMRRITLYDFIENQAITSTLETPN